MFDKSYTLANGKNISVLRGPNGIFKIEKQDFLPDSEQQTIDHETKRVLANCPKNRSAYWIYSSKDKRILSWPGGSIEIEAQNLSDIQSNSTSSLKPLKLTMPGKVLSIKVKEGECVEPGQNLVVVEAMKMENILLASAKAIVDKIHVKAGDRMESGAIILTFRASEEK